MDSQDSPKQSVSSLTSWATGWLDTRRERRVFGILVVLAQLSGPKRIGGYRAIVRLSHRTNKVLVESPAATDQAPRDFSKVPHHPLGFPRRRAIPTTCGLMSPDPGRCHPPTTHKPRPPGGCTGDTQGCRQFPPGRKAYGPSPCAPIYRASYVGPPGLSRGDGRYRVMSPVAARRDKW